MCDVTPRVADSRISRVNGSNSICRVSISVMSGGEALGGRRPAPPASATPSAWRSPGFAAYAAYMLTDVFRVAISTLEGRAVAGEALAVMCAETLWWRCHRRLIADALVSDGFAVRHLINEPPGVLHRTSTPAGTPSRTGPAARDGLRLQQD